MWTDLLMLVPTGLALGLVVFGRYGDRHVPPTRRRAAAVGALAVLLGPVTVATIGFFMWLVMVVVVVAALIMAAVLRGSRTPLRG